MKNRTLCGFFLIFIFIPYPCLSISVLSSLIKPDSEFAEYPYRYVDDQFSQ